MKEKSTRTYPLFCPFTKRELHLLSDEELAVVNEKIANRELSFHFGVPANLPLKRAYSTKQYLYVFPVIDGVLFMKKETAITAKNRVKDPLQRISIEVQEAFYKKYNIGKSQVVAHENERQLLDEELEIFRSRLPKTQELVVTANASSADDVSNLLYEKGVGHHIHIDHDLNRLRSIQHNFNASTDIALIDNYSLPFYNDVINSLVNFEPLEELDKKDQKDLFKWIKANMNKHSVFITACKVKNKLPFKNQLRNGIISEKALKMIRPWIGSKLPLMFFCEIKGGRSSDSLLFTDNQASLSRQMG